LVVLFLGYFKYRLTPKPLALFKGESVYINKNEFINLLEQVGIEIKNNKISKDDVQVILSSVEPEWLLLTDYKMDASENYKSYIENEEGRLHRVVLPASYSIATFGKLVGLVYQYSLKSNPRNVHYAYRLFFGTRPISKNSGFTSLYTAKIECTNEAKNLTGPKLSDTN
jgi:hypothetical protein